MKNLIVTVTAEVQYTCILSDEDSKTVREYAKQNDCCLEEAAEACYYNHLIDLYQNSDESDFSTQSFDFIR